MTSLSVLAVLERQHTGTPVADCISARVGELKAALLFEHRQTLALSLCLGSCLVVQRQDDVRKAVEAEAARKRCDGVDITVGQNERRCFKTAAGKNEYFKDCPTCPGMVVVPAGRFTMGPANGAGARQRTKYRCAYKSLRRSPQVSMR